MDNLPPKKKSGKFFVFPLELIYPTENFQNTLKRIVSFCVLDVGENIAENIHENAIEDMLSRKQMPDDYDEEDEAHRHVTLGCERLKVNAGSVRNILSGAEEAEKIISTAQQVNGESALVFIGAELLWECLAGKMSYRDFTVICAVNSVLGKDGSPQLVRRSLLLARAAGFKTPNQYGKGCTPHFKARPKVTEDQLRWTLDKLEKRNLFSRVQASPRNVYFSKGPREKLMEYVLAVVKKQTPNKINKRRSEERELIRKARAEAGK